MFDGEWKDNKMNGKGKYTWPNGSEYVGEYVNDVKQGYGIYKNEGIVYEGNWVNGFKHGKGRQTDGKIQREGEWENNKRIRWLENSKFDEEDP